MRWVSLEAARAAAAESLKRFPLPLLCAWTAAALGIWQIVDARPHRQMLGATLAASLGISFYFAIALSHERRSNAASAAGAGTATSAAGPPHAPRSARLFELVALAALVIVAVMWPRWSDPIATRRMVQLGIFGHALVAFLPYLGVHEPRGFWHYNRTLLIRLIVASIFTNVLVAGLSGAIAGFGFIFALKISAKVYYVLATLGWLLFHPWFFLSGIPRDLGALEQRTDYPADIKIFAQFILVPLVAIYQALLTAYLVKVIVTQQWPSGVIGWLVSAEAILGILAILLVHPVREHAENLWVRTFSRLFYIALLPSIVMMAMSIAKRVSQYGVTEDRYFAIVLTVWLALISIYFIARREGDIRVIPVTLAALALLTLGGPWGPYSTSRESQTRRLARVLEQNGIRVRGTVRPAAVEPPIEVERNVSSILDYLANTHGPEPIQKLLGEYAMVDDQGPRRPEFDMRRLMKRLGLHYAARWETGKRRQITWNRGWTTSLTAQPLGAYDFHVHVDRAPPVVIRLGGEQLTLGLDGGSRRLTLVRGADSLAVFDLAPALGAEDRTPSRADSLDRGIRLESVAGVAPALLEITQFYTSDDRELSIFGFNADLYFSLKPRGKSPSHE